MKIYKKKRNVIKRNALNIIKCIIFWVDIICNKYRHFYFIKCKIKVEKRYNPEVSDTTMMTKAASLFEQKN